MCACSQSSICSAKIIKAFSLWEGQISIIVSTTDSLKAMLLSSFKQSVKNFKSTSALLGSLWYSSAVDYMVSILKSKPRSGK